MNPSLEYHPDICVLVPCVALAKMRAGLIVLQLGMLFWTVAIEFRCRWL
jgi:hypothetical protein